MRLMLRQARFDAILPIRRRRIRRRGGGGGGGGRPFARASRPDSDAAQLSHFAQPSEDVGLLVVHPGNLDAIHAKLLPPAGAHRRKGVTNLLKRHEGGAELGWLLGHLALEGEDDGGLICSAEAGEERCDGRWGGECRLRLEGVFEADCGIQRVWWVIVGGGSDYNRE